MKVIIIYLSNQVSLVYYKELLNTMTIYYIGLAVISNFSPKSFYLTFHFLYHTYNIASFLRLYTMAPSSMIYNPQLDWD